MIRTISLVGGDTAQVDEEDYKLVSRYTWYLSKRVNSKYALARIGLRTFYMHQLIMPDGPTVDHINGDGLDNRRCNLRYATSQQQMFNRRKWKKASSRFKGVYWDSGRNKWRAYIGYNGKTIHLGSFVDEEKAARAYDKAAKKFHGEHARLNFPDE